MANKLVILALLLALAPICAWGQVTITANVTDPNGVPYSNGNARATLVDANGIDLTNTVVNVNGANIALPAQSKGLSSTGSMSFSLYPNTQISYTSPTSWKFSICSPPTAGGISPPQTCFSSTISISGATDISATLKAASVALVGSLSGGLKFPDGTVQYTANNSGSVSGQANGVVPLATGSNAITSQSHLSDNGSAVTSSEPFNAPSVVAGSVNKTLDLAAQFGATGSNQTMTCTATASSSNLTSCTGGDFVVGNWVYIQSAGITPTISAPGSLSATCNAVNGASCTGSVVYGYQVAAIQGNPNGSVTAATSAVTVTQAAQSPQNILGIPKPTVYTAISFSHVPGANNYLIYKSINSSAYAFYSIVTDCGSGTCSYNDYGNMQGAFFTCTDIGAPCTPPSSAVANDVYAKISAISSGTYTLTALSPSPGYPSQPSQSGSFTIQHDDTPAFTAMSNYLQSNPSTGLTSVHIPCGFYNTHSEDARHIANVIRITGTSNVIIGGDGDCTQINQSNDRSGVSGNFVIGFCEATYTCAARMGLGAGNSSGSSSITVYTLNDPVLLGASSVTLATPSQASSFPAGTWVTVYNYVTSGYPNNFYGEVNRVLSSSTITGVVNLAYPTNKYYSATLSNPPWNTCSACAATPSISPMTIGMAASNITFQNFSYRGHNIFMNVNSIDGLTLNNITVVAEWFENTGWMRHHYIRNNRITEDPYFTQTSALMMGAAGDGDMEAKGNTYNSAHFNSGGQTCTEGSTNISLTENTYNASGIGDSAFQPSGGVFQTASPCFNGTFANNVVNISNSDLASVISLNNGSGRVYGNSFTVDTVGSLTQASAVQLLGGGIATQTWRVYDNDWLVGNGVPGLKVTSNSWVQPSYQSPAAISVSGNVAVYPYYGAFTIIPLALAGNVSSINFGSLRIPGYHFALAIAQAASGGPYTIPGTCVNSNWLTGGSGIDCPQGFPAVNPAASSITYLWFDDDGTTVHLMPTGNYPFLPIIYSAAGTALPTCNAANVFLQRAVSDAPTGSLTPGTAYALGGGTVKCWEQCAYSGSTYAWQSM